MPDTTTSSQISKTASAVTAADLLADEMHDVTVTVNGVARSARVPSRRLLSDFLRHDLRLTGTHVGCEHGVCGACTVLVDGSPTRACLMFAVQAQRHEITTVEGLSGGSRGGGAQNAGGSRGGGAQNAGGSRGGGAQGSDSAETMNHVQRAFAECHGLQCGFCTPGFVTTITAYLEEHDDPTEDEARELISGNLCRCTGYQNIIKSVLRAAEIKREESTLEEGGAA